jgi:hypothetical protein
MRFMRSFTPPLSFYMTRAAAPVGFLIKSGLHFQKCFINAVPGAYATSWEHQPEPLVSWLVDESVL